MVRKYKLDVKRDVDPDGDSGYILNLPRGWRLYDDVCHTIGFDTMNELKEYAKNHVVPCEHDCCVNLKDCKND